jgi:hypothetical protein
MTMLAITTTPPADAEAYGVVDGSSPEVRYRGSLVPGNSPEEIVILLKGRQRQRLVALWDGCAYRI